VTSSVYSLPSPLSGAVEFPFFPFSSPFPVVGLETLVNVVFFAQSSSVGNQPLPPHGPVFYPLTSHESRRPQPWKKVTPSNPRAQLPPRWPFPSCFCHSPTAVFVQVSFTIMIFLSFLQNNLCVSSPSSGDSFALRLFFFFFAFP